MNSKQVGDQSLHSTLKLNTQQPRMSIKQSIAMQLSVLLLLTATVMSTPIDEDPYMRYPYITRSSHTTISDGDANVTHFASVWYYNAATTTTVVRVLGVIRARRARATTSAPGN